jgi:hypothetical protein
VDLETLDYETVLNIVYKWPAVSRLTLIQDILKTLQSELEVPRLQRNTLEQALGLLATDQPPPTDEEIKQWLVEHRLEKYG